MRLKFLIVALSTMMIGCMNTSRPASDVMKISSNLQKLLDEGWTLTDNQSTELSLQYGIKPFYGIQDNYFDIIVGQGYDLALKIIDIKTDRCIRYLYVAANSTMTVSQIPQGQYYLKIAYGNNWVKKTDGDIMKGKFADNFIYEKSVDVFDFGKKNSNDMVNYQLSINVSNEIEKTNFNTKQISEEEFYE